MRRLKKNRGFTMAELLIVVGIITVLSGVGFLAVQTHQRNMAQLERDTIAKEIFFAAQNHLTMAESQGYLSATSLGETYNEDEEAKNIHYALNGTGAPKAGTILDLMLPFGSIDETVRSGGSYLIRYQTDPAVVLDVFYCSTTGKPVKYNHPIDKSDYQSLCEKHGQDKDYLVGYYGNVDAALIGDYNALKSPQIEYENAERLIVKVRYDASQATTAHDATGELVAIDPYLELIVSGEMQDDGTQAKAVILLDKPETSFTPCGRVTGPDSDSWYTVVLDDITSAPDSSDLDKDGMHFYDLNNYGISAEGSTVWLMPDPSAPMTKIPFRPGEDITVQAVTFSNTTFTNIAYSKAITTNSLFADHVSESSLGDDEEVFIGNFRHLENLDPSVSRLDAAFKPASGEQLSVKQIKDLTWTGDDSFTAKIKAAKKSSTVQVYKWIADVSCGSYQGTASGCYLPVNLDYPLVYDGGIEAGKAPTMQGGTDGTNARYHKITGVKVAGNDAAFSGQGGLFGDITETTTIQNLELIDFSINSTGSAGALAGTVTGTASAKAKIENVLAHNSTADATATITSTAGSAGGLIGEMTYCDVNKCAAALVVSGSTNAGGLIGKSSGGSVSGSYCGGHTDAVTGTKYDGDHINVTATSGSAGGLIGDAKGSDSVSTKTTIDCCYSTCSASGTTVGGLVGKVGGSIENSYATGLVKGASATSSVGAFAGEHSSSSFDGCQYFEIINEQTDGTTGLIDYMKPVPGKLAEDEATATADKISGITRIDATAAIYDAFVGVPSTTTGAGNAVKKWTSVMVKDAAGTDTLTCYNASLATLYQNEFSLKTVAQLGADDITETATAETPADFVATHYGDWPAPETLVTNN